MLKLPWQTIRFWTIGKAHNAELCSWSLITSSNNAQGVVIQTNPQNPSEILSCVEFAGNLIESWRISSLVLSLNDCLYTVPFASCSRWKEIFSWFSVNDILVWAKLRGWQHLAISKLEPDGWFDNSRWEIFLLHTYKSFWIRSTWPSVKMVFEHSHLGFVIAQGSRREVHDGD